MQQNNSDRMPFSSDFDMRLINLVKANPQLWERQPRSSPYKDRRPKQAELWQSIATSLKTDVNSCTTRWNNLRQKLRRELAKEKEGVGSDWTLLPKLEFLHQTTTFCHRSSERQQFKQRQHSNGPTGSAQPQLIEEMHADDDPLQEAMDEQQATATTATILPPAGGTSEAANPTPAPLSTDVLKRIGSLLEGLDTPNRRKAEKRILTYLCKCNLRSLNNQQIDDILF